MSQQLSTRVADVIQSRFLALYDHSAPTPQEILDTPHATLRNIGLSNAKVQYIKNVADFELSHGINHRVIGKLTDEEAKEYLTQIKGVGKWTAEMLLMFAMGREDVFAPDDLGIQQAMCALYRISTADKKKMRIKMERIASAWSPYRTYACLYLWRYKDTPK